VIVKECISPADKAEDEVLLIVLDLFAKKRRDFANFWG
jgi:hypothetical protein